MDGRRVWLRILDAVNELMKQEPDGAAVALPWPLASLHCLPWPPRPQSDRRSHVDLRQVRTASPTRDEVVTECPLL